MQLHTVFNYFRRAEWGGGGGWGLKIAPWNENLRLNNLNDCTFMNSASGKDHAFCYRGSVFPSDEGWVDGWVGDWGGGGGGV